MKTVKQMIDIPSAKEYIMANYPNDPLLKHIAVTMLDQLPKVEAAPVVHGLWIEHSHLEIGGECSVCGWQFQWFENDEAHYCPHCGAKMDAQEVSM